MPSCSTRQLFTVSGLNLGFFNAASLIALLTVLMLLIASFRQPLENLGIPVLPIAAATVGLTILNPRRRSTHSLRLVATRFAHSVLCTRLQRTGAGRCAGIVTGGSGKAFT